MHAKWLQLCPALYDPRGCSLPGSSVHGILQAWILEWVTVSSSRGSSSPGDQTWVFAQKADSLLSVPPGKPCLICTLSQTCDRNLSYLGKKHLRGTKGTQRNGQQYPSQQLAIILCYAVKTLHANWFISDKRLIDWTLNRHTLLYCTSQICLFLKKDWRFVATLCQVSLSVPFSQ